MRGDDEKSGTLVSYIDLEARVRRDHPLRAIREIANAALAALSGDFATLYSGLGRPSIAPEKLLRAMLLQAFYSVRSEKQLMERIEFDLLSAVILRPGKTPVGAEMALVLRDVIGRIRARWRAVEIIVRGDSHYGGPRRWHGASVTASATSSACQAIQYCCGESDHWLRMPLWTVSTAKARKSVGTESSATPPKAGRSSAASSLASRLDPKGRLAASLSPICRACRDRFTELARRIFAEQSLANLKPCSDA